jgi:hypothetical protein
MRKDNPLKPFHAGVRLDNADIHLAWHAPQSELLPILPAAMIASQNQYWVSLYCTIFNVPDLFHLNFIPRSGHGLREIQIYDTDEATMHDRFSMFDRTIRQLLGPPTVDSKSQVLWHDDTLVLDLSLKTKIHKTPTGPTVPRFIFSFQNSTQSASHWNNRLNRKLGLEGRG